MKKILKLVFITLIPFSLIACEKKSQRTEPIYELDSTYNKNIEKSNNEDLSLDKNHSHTVEITPAVHSNIPVEFDFKGLETDIKTIEADLLNINYKPSIFKLTTFLVNPDDKTIYYINVGKDNYIYELKDGKNEVIIEERVQSIALWEDEIYYMKRPYMYGDAEGDAEAGKIYKYSLVSNQISLVHDAKACTFTVSESGVFFSTTIKEPTDLGWSFIPSFYILPFGETTPQETYPTKPLKYKNYRIESVYDEENIYQGITFVNEDNGTKTETLPILHDGISLCGDNLYYISPDRSILIRLNLLTGEKTVFDKNSIDNDSKRLNLSYLTYVEINGELYISSGFYEMLKEEENGILRMGTQGMKRSHDEFYNIRDLYTDGNKLYALIENMNNRRRFVEITLEESQEKPNEYLITWKDINHE